MSDDEITCLICGQSFPTIGSHLRTHGINVTEYWSRFPGAETVSIAALKKMCKVCPPSNEEGGNSETVQ